MRRFALTTAAAVVALVGAAGAVSAPNPPAKPLCVGKGPKCFPTLQAALAAAHDGDTIQLGPGTYAGGVTIDASINLDGAGADKTIIQGGGPVVTVGHDSASPEPTVSIAGVTITGGTNTGAAEDGIKAHGGGIWAPGGQDPNGFPLPGATLTIRDSVVSGNSAAPSTTLGPSPDQEPFWPECPGSFPGIAPGFCPYAGAAGGGIASAGALTLDDVTVSGNEAGDPLASDVEGGGIWVGYPGSLTITNSSVANNTASAGRPDGRYSDGGGIFMDGGTTLTVRSSTVTGNHADLTSSFPFFLPDGSTIDMNANGGGIHTGDGGSTTIDNTHIDHNTVTIDDPNGEAVGFDAGLCTCGDNTLVLRNSTVNGNQVVATVGSQADNGASGPGALEFDGAGTVQNTSITGNTTTVTSPDGVAEALGAVGSFPLPGETVTISNSDISGNTATASSTTGSATVQGGGITNDGVMLLQNDRVDRNRGTASGPAGTLQGGGIFDGIVFGGPPIQLTLQNTEVSRNVLTAPSGFTIAGGGIYSIGYPVTATHSHIDHNAPDDCVGC